MAEEVSRQEVEKMIDERIAKLLGAEKGEELEELKAFATQEEQVVMATPSVLSLVRATAYVHC